MHFYTIPPQDDVGRPQASPEMIKDTAEVAADEDDEPTDCAGMQQAPARSSPLEKPEVSASKRFRSGKNVRNVSQLAEDNMLEEAYKVLRSKEVEDEFDVYGE